MAENGCGLVAGRYRPERLLGGSMAEVWCAWDVELERRVVLKRLAPNADRERFEREARAAASLSHPNVCRIFDYGSEAGRPYIVMEWLAGGTLEDRLQGSPLADGETRRVAHELAAGLAHAHAHGLVHRDLKPANILLDGDGSPHISDFGIAWMSGAQTVTEAGTILGTAAYLSPEQARGDPATPRSDVYALGVVLYRMLTGRLPFDHVNALALAALHVNEPLTPVRRLRPDTPADLAAVAEAALAKDPTERPADGAALGALLDGTGSSAEAAAAEGATGALASAPPRRPRPGTPALAALLLGALLAAGAGTAVVLTRGPSSAPAAPPRHQTGKSTTGSTSSGGATTPRTPAPPLGTTRGRSASTARGQSTATTRGATTPPTAEPPTTTAPAATPGPPTTTAPDTTSTTNASTTSPAVTSTSTTPAAASTTSATTTAP